MIDDQILHHLAALNPVRDEPAYDESAERALMALLDTVRAQAAPVPAPTRPVVRPRLARYARWGATVSIAAVLTLVVVIINGGTGGQHTLLKKPSTAPAIARIDAHGLVADRTMAALAVARNYLVQGEETQIDASGVRYRSVTTTDEQSAVNFADVEYSSSGAPSVQETDFAIHGGVVILNLDDRARQYTETSLTTLEYAHRFGFRSVAELNQSSLPTSEAMRRDLVKGNDRLLGHVRLHGRSALVLASDEPNMHRRIWVDATSYLPIRMTEHPQQGMSVIINYTWIPRTKQAVAATFAPHIPPGFTRVNKLPGS